MTASGNPEVVVLPPPRLEGPVSLEAAMLGRRSVRQFGNSPLTLPEVSQLLWAAQGITHADGLRTAASAHAIYPLAAYVIVGRVEALAAGVYKHNPPNHHLLEVKQGDSWGLLWSTVLADRAVKESAAVLVFTATYAPITDRYGPRGERFVHVEIGHVVQNVYLQVAAMGLATVEVGSFADAEVAAILGCPDTETPMILMPVGRRQ